jgi:hypothetical protein
MGLPRAPNLPEQVVQFAPKEKPPRNAGDELDQAGEATIALLQQAANLSNERCDRAMDLGHQLSLKLRAAEDRLRHLQAERDQFQDRAARAKEWLTRIYHEVEEKLMSPRAGSPRASL